MEIHVSIQGRRDLSGQIYRQLREAILAGRVAGGERLPSTRDLALQLGVSRKTTLEAFERLTAEGFLLSRAGDGTFVAPGIARVGKPAGTDPGSTGSEVEAAPVTLASVWSRLPTKSLLPRPDQRPRLDFQGGAIDKSRFPFDVWRRCLHRGLQVLSQGRGMYRDAAGEEALRREIARYLAFNRAVVSDWQDILVTQGAQQAMDLMARVMVDPGTVVAMEEPGYPPARLCFEALGARIEPVPVDAQGIVVECLPDDARLVYVTPSHQFPLGMPMSLERRLALLEWAQRRGAVIVEDDYDGEYRFEGRPVDSLKSLDRAGLVAYMGTFSKTIFPELRIGYLVPPPALRDTLRRARQLIDSHGCCFTQNALAAFMLDGEFAKHLRRMHKVYAARRQALLEHLHGPLAEWFETIVPAAGIHMAAYLKAPLSEARLIEAARGRAIGLMSLSAFHAGKPTRPGVVFGYGGIEVEDIDAALRALAELIPALLAEENQISNR
jgi:GntR family transcriptional regulator / MocR family aminotransferase